MRKCKTALIFPFYGGSHDDVPFMGECYDKALFKGAKVYVIDDGMKNLDSVLHFEEEMDDGKCVYCGLYPRSGLTRSWNYGAMQAFNDGHDVVILGNADAWPDCDEDLEGLAKKAQELKDTHFAVGPLTNNPGHVKRQLCEDPILRSDTVEDIDYINGFTWAVHRDNWEKILQARGFFLMDRFNRVYCMKKGVLHFSGDRRASLAMVGQEDEIFDYARSHLKLKCAINHDSFWWHTKLSLHRNALV